MLVILAFVADTFVMDAVMIETLLKEALVDSCNILLTNKLVIDAVLIHTLLNEAFVDVCNVLFMLIIFALTNEQLLPFITESNLFFDVQKLLLTFCKQELELSNCVWIFPLISQFFPVLDLYHETIFISTKNTIF